MKINDMSVTHDIYRKIEKLEEQNKILKDALEFYADETNWCRYTKKSYSISCISEKDWSSEYLGNDGHKDCWRDAVGGKLAREVLKNVR